MTLDQLLKGKGTIINDNSFFKTADYVNPFIDRMSKFTDNFIIKVKQPSQITYGSDGDIDYEDITYNRVYIQAVLPDDFAWDNHKQAISMLYGLDVRKPVVKFFEGTINMACTNLCVFQPNQMIIQDLQPETAIDYRSLDQIINITDEAHAKLKKLSELIFDKKSIYEDLGRWIDNCINFKFNNGYGNIKLSETLPVQAFKSVFYKTDSDYYKSDGITDGLNMYNAFTQLITDSASKDPISVFEKTLLISKLFNV